MLQSRKNCQKFIVMLRKLTKTTSIAKYLLADSSNKSQDLIISHFITILNGLQCTVQGLPRAADEIPQLDHYGRNHFNELRVRVLIRSSNSKTK